MKADFDQGFVINDQGMYVPQGSVAQKLLACNMDPNALRPYYIWDKKHNTWMPVVTQFSGNEAVIRPTTNATLRKDEWKELDKAVLEVRQERLTGIQDLINAGLVYNLTNALGKTVLEYEKMKGEMQAQMSIDALRRGDNTIPEYDPAYLPLPITHADFQINLRKLNASRSSGEALDTTTTRLATRAVMEKLEETLFTNTTFAYASGTIYSYINHPDRNTGTLHDAWSDSAATAAGIVNDVLTMKQALINKHFYGPYTLYIPTGYETVLDEDYDTTRGNTIRQRILNIEGISQIKVADKLPANNVVLVQFTQDVVRLVNGMAPTPVEWETMGGFVHNFKVMAIQVPQIRSDANSSCGIAHYTAS